ncbi:MAG: hypothetical protein K8F91_25330, partial [Candidatus Obscuribacterales bacterium]|nr:hypothetical protein [Candidatus Obscuribacterales bacterium]
MFKNLFHIVINKLCPWLAAVSLVVLALTTGTAGLAKAETTVDCLVLHQRDLKAGKMTVYFAGDVVRVDAMNGQGTIISRAPDWNVLIFNRDKQSIKVGPKEWHMRGLDRIMKSKREFKWKPAKDQYLG